MSARVIGVDPGPTPGVVVLEVSAGRLESVEVLQCTHGLLLPLLAALDHEHTALVAIERFVVRGRANADQALTRDQVAVLLARFGANAVCRSAAQVKPWATDDRLEAAGLLDACKGMRHARDAARHALHAAVNSAALTDPLSKDWTQ